MTIQPIRTEEDHAAALARIEEIFAAKPGTPEYDELDALATLIDAYERAHHHNGHAPWAWVNGDRVALPGQRPDRGR